MAFQFEHINLSPFSMTMQILAQYGLTAFLYAAAALAAAGIGYHCVVVDILSDGRIL